MRRISSNSIWWEKRVSPAIWFGFVGAFVPIAILGAIEGSFPASAVLIPIGMLIFGYVLMLFLVFPLVDEVSILGEKLIVRKGKIVDQIALRDVKYAQASKLTNPEQVLVVLHRPCAFGDQFSFAPLPRRSWGFWPLDAHPIAQELSQIAWDLNHPKSRETSEHVTELPPNSR